MSTPANIEIDRSQKLRSIALLIVAEIFAMSLWFVSAAILGGADWRSTVLGASVLAVIAAIIVLAVRNGQFHTRAASFNPAAIKEAWTNPSIRRAYGGYPGHLHHSGFSAVFSVGGRLCERRPGGLIANISNCTRLRSNDCNRSANPRCC